MKKWLNNILYGYFHFNKQERNGVLVLACLIAMALLLRILLPYLLPKDPAVQFAHIDFAKLSDMDSLKQASGKQDDTSPDAHQPEAAAADKFVFDPNTISLEEAVRLGFPDRTARILVNFRNKGGKFFKPEDLKKLYGISEQLYSELEAYILIPPRASAFKKDTVYPAYPKKYAEKKPYHIELNGADSLSIVMLKGIGPALTKRIIRYRTMLGGFYSTDQLKEVYGMKDSVIQVIIGSISVDPQLLTKIAINKVEFNELRKHPYLTFQTTQAIINYRSKHGRLSEESMKAIGVFDEEKLRRLMPYLDFK